MTVRHTRISHVQHYFNHLFTTHETHTNVLEGVKLLWFKEEWRMDFPYMLQNDTTVENDSNELEKDYKLIRS